jgi:thioredoxin 1
MLQLSCLQAFRGVRIINRQSTAISLLDLGKGSVSFADAVTEPSMAGCVVVDFYATWCGPCKIAAKTFQSVADELEGNELQFVKVNTEVHGQTVDAYGLKGLPVFAVFKNGQMLVKHEGNLGKAALIEFIKKGVPQ